MLHLLSHVPYFRRLRNIRDLLHLPQLSLELDVVAEPLPNFGHDIIRPTQFPKRDLLDFVLLLGVDQGLFVDEIRDHPSDAF